MKGMFLTLAHSLVLLEQYKYLLIFPIMVIEGPIITVISGFLVHMNILNGYITLPLLILGDLIGDFLHYLIGKYGKRSKFLMRIAVYLGYNERKEKVLEKHFQKHTGKTLLFAKVSHGVGGIIQIASGVAGIRLFDFMWFSFLGTVPKTTVLFFIGYFLGTSYQRIDNYFDVLALITLCMLVAFALLFFSPNKFVNKLLSQDDSLDK